MAVNNQCVHIFIIKQQFFKFNIFECKILWVRPYQFFINNCNLVKFKEKKIHINDITDIKWETRKHNHMTLIWHLHSFILSHIVFFMIIDKSATKLFHKQANNFLHNNIIYFCKLLKNVIKLKMFLLSKIVKSVNKILGERNTQPKSQYKSSQCFCLQNL